MELLLGEYPYFEEVPLSMHPLITHDKKNFIIFFSVYIFL